MGEVPINGDVSKMSLDDLFEILSVNLDEMIACKAAINEINAELLTRYGENIAATYVATGKSHGTVRLNLSNGFILEVDKDSTVTWDQAMMTEIAGDMPWEKSRHLFKFKIEMGEATFKALPPDDFKSRLTDARTVKIGSPKLTLKRAEPRKGKGS